MFRSSKNERMFGRKLSSGRREI